MKEYKFEVYIVESRPWVMCVYARSKRGARRKIKRLVPDVEIKQQILIIKTVQT